MRYNRISFDVGTACIIDPEITESNLSIISCCIDDSVFCAEDIINRGLLKQTSKKIDRYWDTVKFENDNKVNFPYDFKKEDKKMIAWAINVYCFKQKINGVEYNNIDYIKDIEASINKTIKNKTLTYDMRYIMMQCVKELVEIEAKRCGFSIKNKILEVYDSYFVKKMDKKTKELKKIIYSDTKARVSYSLVNKQHRQGRGA